MPPEIKELIEYAAKALGYGGRLVTKNRMIREFCFQDYTYFQCNSGQQFNPLTSPADSHALMCELEIDTMWHNSTSEVWAYHRGIWIKEHYTTDKALACRLTVLRVAAEIGKRKDNS